MMTTTQWVIEDDPELEACYELGGHRYGSGDGGASILCSMLCAEQGRHVHIDYCRNPDNCTDDECRHIPHAIHPDPDRPKDWVSHRLHWARADPKHSATTSTPACPSYCTLPALHKPQTPGLGSPNGYISSDGHLFDCPNPVELYSNYHILFVVDSSSSMGWSDRKPLSDTPVSSMLRSACNNRYGAALSALYGFCSSRVPKAGSLPRSQQDAYSVITFNDVAKTRISKDVDSTPEALINLLKNCHSGGLTDFAAAIRKAQSLIERNWDDNRTPVVIFLSDGECGAPNDQMYEMCRMCVRLGKALSFHAVSFGTRGYSTSLQKMVDLATEVYHTAPRETREGHHNVPCSYANALDSVELSNTFLRIGDSLQRPKAALIVRREPNVVG
ncbi:von willebrand factor type A domain protein [Ceratobasidium sp. AG-Ba]|nr:von willebrand factor type A domain protein [Ceratobasidium sp. AG-Ba]QRV98825.1 von willebrand factor type A domain protein [Ceratobasidium sp. AG-Ba]